MPRGQVAICKPGSKPVAEAVRDALKAFEMAPAAPEELAEARAFAAALIGGEIADLPVVRQVHARTGGALFLAKEAGLLTGVLATVLLTDAGVRACFADTFEALDPDVGHVAPAEAAPAGAYAWGVAASTRDTAKRIVAAGASLYANELGHLPYFTRPTTAAGARLAVERFGFQPVPGTASGLVWMPSRHRAASVAA